MASVIMAILGFVKQLFHINKELLEMYTLLVKIWKTCENCDSIKLITALVTLGVSMLFAIGILFGSQNKRFIFIIIIILSLELGTHTVKIFLEKNTCKCPNEIMLLKEKHQVLDISLKSLEGIVDNQQKIEG